MVAITMDDLQGVRTALERDRHINITDSDGRTALMHAAINGNCEIANLLIESGADLDLADRMGFTALHYASQSYNYPLAERLLKGGAKTDIRDRYGNTALWRAVFNAKGRAELPKLLLSNGASPIVKNHSDVSPLDLARTIGHPGVIELLEIAR
jgi:uncharacterized protein